jgi:hypothetical protein
MAKAHFVLDTDFTLDFTLWGMHTNLSGYALAYHLNTILNSRFQRATRDLIGAEGPFAFYQWDEPQKGIYCELLQNKLQKELKAPSASINLFDVETTKEVYLLPEVKQAPFLFKIHEGITPQTIKTCLANSSEVLLFYALEDERLKTKLNILTLK